MLVFNSRSEHNILRMVRYGTVIPTIVLSILITYTLIQNKNIALENEIELIKSVYLQENKEIVKNEVQRTITMIENEIKNQDKSLKSILKNKVYEAHNIASSIYKGEMNNILNKKLTKKHTFEIIKSALGGMIYNKGRGYMFIDDIHGNKLLQPLHKDLEGKNLLEYKDAKGYQLVKKIVKTIKNKGEAFDYYYWFKLEGDKKFYKKISFYKYFEPYNVAIGTGEYLVDYENELKTKILKIIQNTRFGKNSYIFVFDKKGNYLSHLKKKKIGTNGFKIKDAQGKYFIKDFIEFAIKNKEGYYSYFATSKPSKYLKTTNKISYLSYFERWGWIIGTGFYLDDLNKKIKEKETTLIEDYQKIINNILILSLIITTILLFISFYISKIIAQRFTSYQKSIKKEIEKTIQKDKLLIQQSKMAMMGEMIANISHQWRQPLSAISTAATGSKMQKEFNLLEDKDFYKAMNLINDSAQYLSETIEDFRNFFQPTKKKTSFYFEDLFKKVSKLLLPQLRDNNIHIIENIEPCKFTGHENELLQVVMNIIKNAKDALLEQDYNFKKLVFINVSQKDEQIFIKIRDNAGGIDKTIINKIFEPYFTTKDSSIGTGIGLYMSKQIIEKMNGRIEVKNCEFSYEDIQYKGVEFIIVLNKEKIDV
ncbi:MAG: histidine kinase [Arcobacter sp.]|nr:MAG: histidine kinase [Arcobacter sp.]